MVPIADVATEFSNVSCNTKEISAGGKEVICIIIPVMHLNVITTAQASEFGVSISMLPLPVEGLTATIEMQMGNRTTISPTTGYASQLTFTYTSSQIYHGFDRSAMLNVYLSASNQSIQGSLWNLSIPASKCCDCYYYLFFAVLHIYIVSSKKTSTFSLFFSILDLNIIRIDH